MTALTIHPLTPDRWDDFVELLGSDSVARRCWCMANRLPSGIIAQTPPAARKAAMKKLVDQGEMPGLLAYRDKQAVAWVAIAPRSQTPAWNTGRKASAVESDADASDAGCWGASCFFVRPGHRGKGLTVDLLEACLGHARAHGAERVEACPMSDDDRRSTVAMCAGPKRIFERAGFDTVLERKPGRPLMRLTLGRTKAARGAASTSTAKATPRARSPRKAAT